MQGYLKARAAQARALEQHWDVARAHTRQSNLGQGMAAAWVTATVRAGVTQCSCSNAGAGSGGSNRGGDSNWWQHWEKKVIMARVTQGTGAQ